MKKNIFMTLKRNLIFLFAMLISITFYSAFAVNVSDSVGYYSFDRYTGNQWTYDFDGVDDYIEVGDIGETDEIELWLKLEDTTGIKTFARVDTNHNLRINNDQIDTINFAGVTIYVDGVMTNTVSADTVHHIRIVYDDIDSQNTRIGSSTSRFFEGKIYNVSFYDDGNLKLRYDLKNSLNNLLGDNLVINGEFENDTDWTKAGNWEISQGTASTTDFGGNQDLQPSTSLNLAPNTNYEVSYTIINNTGGSSSLFIRINSQFFTSYFDNPLGVGQHKTILKTTTGGNLVFRAVSGHDVTIDNISIREVEELTEVEDLSGNGYNGTITNSDVENLYIFDRKILKSIAGDKKAGYFESGDYFLPQSTNGLLTTNYNFDTGTGLTTGTGWSVGSGVASSDGSQSSASDLTFNYPVSLNKKITVTYDIVSRSSGSVRAKVGSSTGSFQSSTGTYTEEIITTSSGDFKIEATDDFVGSIDNVIIEEEALSKTRALNFKTADNDYAIITNPYEVDTNDFSYSLWFNLETFGNHYFISNVFTTRGSNKFQHTFSTSSCPSASQCIRSITKDSSATNIYAELSDGTDIETDRWYHLVFTREGGTCKFYLNGLATTQTSTSCASGDISTGEDWVLGNFDTIGTSNGIEGSIDELAVYDRALNSSEVTKLYNDSVGFNPYITFEVSSPPSVTPIISHNISNLYNKNNFTIGLSALSNTNMSYILNSGVKTSLCDNCTSHSLFLSGLSEGLNTIKLISEDEHGSNNNTKTFTIDLTNPNIFIVGPIINDFLVDFSQIIAYNDSLSGVNTCLIDIIYVENVTNSSQYNVYNLQCDDSYHFEAAGRYNATITLTDNAGNIETLSISKIIKPFVYINFFDEDNNLLNNYNAILYHPDGDIVFYNNQTIPLNISPYHDDKGLDLGEYIVTFDLGGFILSNHSFILNETSGGENINVTIEEAVINLKIYDYITNQLITDSVSISLIPTSYTDSITTGETNITGLTLNEGEYQIIATSQNYETETIFFNYDFQSYLEQIIYMVKTNESNLGVLVIQIEDSSSKIENQLVNLLAWSSNESAFITVGQSKTNSNGLAYFNVELDNTLYKAKSTLNGQTETTAEQTIKVSGETIVITFNDVFETYPVQEDISYLLTNSTHNATHQLILFTFEDNNNLVHEFCLEARKQIINANSLINKKCVTTNSGELSFFIDTNQSYNTIVQGVVYKNDGRIVLDSIIYKSTGNIESSLSKLSIFFILASFVITIALGVKLQNVSLIAILTIINSWLMYSVFSNTITYTVPLLITVIMIIVLYATFKKRF